jgi:hypothetical protein
MEFLLQCIVTYKFKSFFGSQEPTHLVVFDIAFKTDTYFDGALGVLKKVDNSFFILD